MSNYNELKITYQGGSQETITLAGNTIEYGAYQYRNIVAVEVPEIVQTIGGYAFCDNNNLANIVLNEGLQTIEGQAFQHGVYSAVTIPSTVENIGWNAFNIFDEQDDGTAGNLYITCLASTPPRLEAPDKTFGNPDLLTIYVPAESVELYKANWGGYADKIQAIPTPITTLDITTAYIGDTEVTKLYLGDNLVYQAEDPMLRTPLTLEITSVGTAATPLLGLCLSGWTSSAVTKISDVDSAATYITYTINDGEPQVLALSGAVSNSAVTRAISGVAVGDVIRFYATSGTVGSRWTGTRVANRHALGCAATIHTHFVHSAGLEANIYGNINSLLVTKDEFDLYAAGDDTIQFNASAYTFEHLFMGRSGFTFGTPTSEKHIVLPEPTTGLQPRCYLNMFADCTGLTTAPALPATTLADSCFYGMFEGCTSLTVAPVLPATILATYCYGYMFQGCTSLTTAPELPATTLANSCYSAMFAGCTSLTSAPELPITTLAQGCYSGMFKGCTSLTTAPELPASILADYCYENMFRNCTSLTIAPELPATTLANSCYSAMFQGCSSLTTAPALPATNLTTSCYGYMFKGCTSLTTAPELPATSYDSTNRACQYMFQNCSNLNYIKCMFHTAPSGSSSFTNPVYNWVSGVAASGTFVRYTGVNWPTGNNGIPNGWTVIDADE